MRHLVAVVVLLAVVGLPSCAREMAEESAEAPAAAPAPAPPAPAADQAAVQTRSAAQQAAAERRPVSRKLVRTVEIDMEVRSTEEAARTIQALADRLGGYVAAASANRVEGLLHYTITLRVPVERLDPAMAEIKKLAVRVNREHQAVEDVTDRYVDLDARLRTLQATERELQALLGESRQQGRKVEEIMAVYRELTEIRSQAEQIQGQLLTLEKLAALSTINVSLTPTEAARPVAPERWQPSETVRASARTLLAVLRGLADVAIFVAIVLLPVAAVVGAVLLALRWIWRRLRPRRTPVAPPG